MQVTTQPNSNSSYTLAQLSTLITIGRYLATVAGDAPAEPAGVAGPNLVSPSLLRLPGGAGVQSSAHTHLASLYPTAGEATVTRRSPGSGRQFRIDTPSGKRQWVLDAEMHARIAKAEMAGEVAQLASVQSDLEVSEYMRWRRFIQRHHQENQEQWACQRRETSEEKNARRASSTLRKYCRHNSLDHLWTLTFKVGVYEWSTVVEHWNYFLERFGRLLGGMPLAGVIEPHPEGHGYHIHFAVRGFVDVADIRKCWTYGRIHVAAIKGRKISRRGVAPKIVAGYLAKYVSKTLTGAELLDRGLVGRAPGQHRYFVREGSKPERLRFYCYGRDAAFRLLASYMGAPKFVWCSVQARDWSGPLVHWLDYLSDRRSAKSTQADTKSCTNRHTSPTPHTAG